MFQEKKRGYIWKVKTNEFETKSNKKLSANSLGAPMNLRITNLELI